MTKCLILGSTGLVGTSLIRRFQTESEFELLTPRREEVNLFDQFSVSKYIQHNSPDWIIDAAARVGGIIANNSYRADFIHENLLIQSNVFHAAFKNNIRNLMFLGSSCIYPRECPQPIKEEYLLTGPLEQTNEPYAIAKIAGLKTAENFRRQYGLNYFSVMPTNLYGPNDNFHPENSHVIPGLITRLDKAIQEKQSTFEVWGSGKVKREFLFVEDLADACLFLLQTNKEIPYWINVGSGIDITIKDLAIHIAELMGYEGDIVFNTERPDGNPRKLLDVSKMTELGWQHSTHLRDGLARTIDFYKSTQHKRS